MLQVCACFPSTNVSNLVESLDIKKPFFLPQILFSPDKWSKSRIPLALGWDFYGMIMGFSEWSRVFHAAAYNFASPSILQPVQRVTQLYHHGGAGKRYLKEQQGRDIEKLHQSKWIPENQIKKALNSIPLHT